MSVSFLYNNTSLGTYSSKSTKTLTTGGKYAAHNISVVSNIMPLQSDLGGYVFHYTGDVSLVKTVKVSLTFGSTITMTVGLANSQTDANFYADKTIVYYDRNGNEYPLSLTHINASWYGVAITDIEPREFQTEYVFKIKKDDKEFVMYYSVFAFLNENMFRSGLSDAAKDLYSSTYWYGLSARNLFG